jgi:hypothetical protein
MLFKKRFFFKLRKLLTLGFIGVFLAASLPAIAQASSDRVIDIAQITWTGAPKPEASSSEIANAIQTKVSESWKTFTTLLGDNQDRSLNFMVGKTLETPIKLSAPMNCAGNGFISFTNALRSEVYSKLGITDFKTRYLVLLSPAAGCIWSGRATLGSFSNPGGVIVLHNTANAFVITHELGHTLGLGHSNLLRCDSSAKDGAWSRSCKAVEYGGSIDVMGNVETSSKLSTYHQWRLGLLGSSEVKQSWINENIELVASDVIGGLRAVFIRDGGATYWIEYRRPSAINEYKPGLVVYRTDPPPSAFIDSPNPEDQFGGEANVGVGTDMWMLNLDNYNYSSTGVASGSMTLPSRTTFAFYSGNVTLEALPTDKDDRVLLKIARKADTTPPPTPSLSSSKNWNSPDFKVLEGEYEDRDSIISNFELRINDKLNPGKFGSKDSFVPTYLDPFVSRKSLFVKDLPEGSYSLSVRGVDIWGNTSDWSRSQQVLIDRSQPNVGSSLNILSLQENKIQVSLSDFSDAGSGLCKTSLFRDNSFIFQDSEANKSPTFNFLTNEETLSNFQSFDCLGNGVSGKLRIVSSYRTAADIRKSGKWTLVQQGGLSGLKCVGKCTMSTTAKDNVTLVTGEGSADILLAGRQVARFMDSRRTISRIGVNLNIGSKSKLMRISGKDFAIFGIIQTKIQLSELENTTRAAISPDLSIADDSQRRMSQFGFRQTDFANGWTVVPMERGTTLLDPTLDLCSSQYKSEINRQFRRQMIALKSDSPYLFLSSESVKYRDQSAATAALNELQANYAACVKNKGGIESSGTFIDYEFSPINIGSSQLVGENARVLVRAQIGKGSAARQLLAFYQFKGEIFTGLYIVKNGEVGFSEAEVRDWLSVAAVLANRLEKSF